MEQTDSYMKTNVTQADPDKQTKRPTSVSSSAYSRTVSWHGAAPSCCLGISSSSPTWHRPCRTCTTPILYSSAPWSSCRSLFLQTEKHIYPRPNCVSSSYIVWAAQWLPHRSSPHSSSVLRVSRNGSQPRRHKLCYISGWSTLCSLSPMFPQFDISSALCSPSPMFPDVP